MIHQQSPSWLHSGKVKGEVHVGEDCLQADHVFCAVNATDASTLLRDADTYASSLLAQVCVCARARACVRACVRACTPSRMSRG